VTPKASSRGCPRDPDIEDAKLKKRIGKAGLREGALEGEESFSLTLKPFNLKTFKLRGHGAFFRFRNLIFPQDDYIFEPWIKAFWS
jgi:hypothetical protein